MNFFFFFQICKILLNAHCTPAQNQPTYSQIIFFSPIKIILRKFLYFFHNCKFYISIYCRKTKYRISIPRTQLYVKWNSDINMRRCKMMDDCQHLCNPAICVSRLCLSERRRTSLFSLLISAGENHEYCRAA